jgi:hypothetical protein
MLESRKIEYAPKRNSVSVNKFTATSTDSDFGSVSSTNSNLKYFFFNSGSSDVKVIMSEDTFNYDGTQIPSFVLNPGGYFEDYSSNLAYTIHFISTSTDSEITTTTVESPNTP